MATDIRIVLTDLADRISKALQNQQEIDGAVSRLLKLKPDDTDSTETKSKPVEP
jgi:hypothetical protein